MKKTAKLIGIIALVAVIGFSMMGCDFLNEDDDGNSGSGGGSGGSAGSSRERAIAVTVGYSASHTISSSGENIQVMGTL